MAQEHFGVFEKDNPEGGVYKLVAATPADAVKYTFDGWRQTGPSTSELKAAEKAAKKTAADQDSADEPAGKATAKSK